MHSTRLHSLPARYAGSNLGDLESLNSMPHDFQRTGAPWANLLAIYFLRFATLNELVPTATLALDAFYVLAVSRLELIRVARASVIILVVRGIFVLAAPRNGMRFIL